MASVLANVLRNQARVALAVSRTRVTSSTAAFFNLASQRSTPSYSRSLSISQVVRDDYGYSGERIRPPTPPCTTIFVGNLPYSVEAGELTELLSTFGEIKSVRPGVRPDGTSKGYAHVEFTELSTATKVLEAHKEDPFSIGGRNVRLDYAPPPNRVAAQPNHKLYIYDFPKDEASLRMAFKDFDETIMSVSLMKDAAGKSTGAGFVEFGSIPQATDALEALNEREIEYGVKLNLSYARPRKPRDSSRRGYGWDSQEGRNSGGYDGGRGGGRGGYSRGGGRGGYSGRGERERGGGYRDDGGY